MSDFVKVLEDELAALELAMANDPKAVEARMIRELLANHASRTKESVAWRLLPQRGAQTAHASVVQDMAKPDSPSSPTVSVQAVKDVLANLAHSAEQDTKKPAPVARNGKGAHMKDEIAQLISERGAPVHRADILKHLTRKKMIGHEANPMANLSTRLWSWRDDFVSDGHGNFSLRNGQASESTQADASQKHEKTNPLPSHGAQLGRLGGVARAKKLSAAQRSAIAQQGASKRWQRRNGRGEVTHRDAD